MDTIKVLVRGIAEILLRALTRGIPEFSTPAAPGLEELFSAFLERLLQPIHALRV
jgi:hypothetical protein